jgi:hypothetical protein
VSDVLAFIFTFSIIITSVGVVSAVGFSSLRDIQEGEQAVNAERAFVTLGENLGNVERGHAPGRSGELRLNQGSLYVQDGREVSVSVDDGSGSGPSFGPRDLQALYYDMDGSKTNVVLEGGAVFREDRGNVVAVEGPSIMCNGDRAVVSLVEMRHDGTIPGGTGTVQVTGREESSELLYSGAAENVTIDLSSHGVDGYASAWEDELTGDGWAETGTDGEVECDLDAGGRAYVRVTTIRLNFVN